MVPLCRFLVGLCRGNYELAWVCYGFCNRWQRKWFLFASSSWDDAEIMNWLGSVVDSVTGGSKNGSSVPVLRGTMLAKKNVRDCRGFCKRWQQKWFLSVGSSWDYAGEDY